MTLEELTLPLRSDKHGFVMAPVVLDTTGPVRLSVTPPGSAEVTGAGHDVVAALRDVRIRLEEAGYLLWVNGARRNVHATEMLREMEDGRLAYVLPQRRTADRPLSADVLQAPPPDADVVTVAEQDAWYDAWLASPLEDAPRAAPGASGPRRPSAQARQAARTQPGGWVYEILGDYGPEDAVPPEAVLGAWKVDDEGNIVGELVKNPRFSGPPG